MILKEALPDMKNDWDNLTDIDVWSDGLQFWFKEGGLIRDICIRPSGTDAKSKVYFDGKDKNYLENVFTRNFENFSPQITGKYRDLLHIY